MSEKKKTTLFSASLMTIRKWHWMSAALCFMCLLLFSVTGITLHHSRLILPEPSVTHINGVLPEIILPALVLHHEQKKLAMPAAVVDWLFANKKIVINENNRADAKKEFSNNAPEKIKGAVKEDNQLKQFYAVFNRPSVSEKITINIATGEFNYEKTDKGWLAYFNDLHKGKNTGMAWVYFMDMFSVACIIFSITGFILLQRYAKTRAKTWPLLAAGFFMPIFFMLFLIH